MLIECVATLAMIEIKTEPAKYSRMNLLCMIRVRLVSGKYEILILVSIRAPARLASPQCTGTRYVSGALT